MTDFYVISKGRADSMSTSAILSSAGIRHRVVVEPQEAAAYRAAATSHAEIVVLPKSEQGIVFVRQFVLELARGRAKDCRRFCMMDDDLKGVGTVRANRCVKGDGGLLLKAADIFERSGLAQMGLQYNQYAWCAKSAFTCPCHCDCVSFFDVERTRQANYDPYVAMKEDWDFSLQVLRSGGMTGVFNRIWMSVPTMGTNGGGLADLYRQNRDFEAARRLRAKWGGELVKLTKKSRDGRTVIDTKVNWKAFNRKGGS